MKKILVILGPTATGKTDIAIRLAKKLNGEVIACDSRQLYQGLDIGTGKLPSTSFKNKIQISKHIGYWIIDGVKIWMYDMVSPSKQYNAFQYYIEARKKLKNILARGKLPIITAGTGLYLKGVLGEFSYLSFQNDPKLRQKLEKEGIEVLQKRLAALSPIFFQDLNNSEKNNKRRLIRKIEILLHPNNISKPIKEYFDILKIGLTAPREILNQRIDQRVIARVNQGMIEEAKKLSVLGLSFKRMRELGLEYRILADYLQGVIKSKEEFINILQTKIHQYSKRQLTWYKKYEADTIWVDITEKSWRKKVENLILDWYNSTNASDN